MSGINEPKQNLANSSSPSTLIHSTIVNESVQTRGIRPRETNSQTHVAMVQQYGRREKIYAKYVTSKMFCSKWIIFARRLNRMLHVLHGLCDEVRFFTFDIYMNWSFFVLSDTTIILFFHYYYYFIKTTFSYEFVFYVWLPANANRPFFNIEKTTLGSYITSREILFIRRKRIGGPFGSFRRAWTKSICSCFSRFNHVYIENNETLFWSFFRFLKGNFSISTAFKSEC